MSSRYARSEELFRRATRVIPGGLHLSGRPLGEVGTSPMYMERGKGCTVWDVDGNEYIDLFMAFGPFLLGYAHPEVDGAVIRQVGHGHLLSMNHPLHVGFIEKLVGVVPDLTTLSKALGNGWPVAAVIGSRAVMEHGSGMHYSGTYHGDTCGVTAALTTLDLVDSLGVAEHVDRLGRRLIEGLNELARTHRVCAEAYGEPLPAMPFLRFTHPDEAIRAACRATFYREVYERGVLLHPRHLWFVSHAHSPEDIERVLDVCDQAFGAMFRAHPWANC